MANELVFGATVASGRGRAAGFLEQFSQDLTGNLGAPAIPGSLNLFFDHPVEFSPSAALSFSAGGRCFWEARLNGRRCILYRWRKCPLHVVECISDTHLRSNLGLDDGARVSLEVSSTEEVSAGRSLAWSILWSARRDWFYGKDTYYRRAQKIPILSRLSWQKIPDG